MESSNTSPNKAIVAVIVVALIAIAATAVIVMSSGKDTSTAADSSQTASQSSSAQTQSTTGTTTNTTVPANSSATFKDGTYTATSRYDTPGGGASIGVSVTLKGSTITDATLTQGAPDREAQEFQDRFASGYKSLVVGKKITDVSLTRVAGSSLTPIGFNNALQDIENQAKA